MFLFIDMEGSTGFAERLGALAFHRLYDGFIVDLAGPIAAARGEIHRYVGDELIATWIGRRDHGHPPYNGLFCCDRIIDAPGAVYQREFGAPVRFRAACIAVRW